MDRKKRILIWTDHPGIKSGFAKIGRNLAEHLYQTNKYELAYFCCGVPWNTPEFYRWPWKMYGALPQSQNEYNELMGSEGPEQRAAKERWAAYGNYNLDKVIKDFKPDVIIGMNDPWGFDVGNRKWIDKIPLIVFTTIDSLPLLPQAIELCKKVPHYWVWSRFAERAFHKIGEKKVKTFCAPMKTNKFRPLGAGDKVQLRQDHDIPQDAFVTGFVFRNQLRKSVIALMEGFRTFKLNNANIKNPRLLLHTSLSEGWNIPERMKELGIPEEEVLFTQICIQCGKYHVKKFTGQHANCKFCGIKGHPPSPQDPNHKEGTGLVTTSVIRGITEEQLNEVYNLMDQYVHPITSGGLEIPIFEAKLAGVPTAVTNYSCGEDVCVDEAGSYPLTFSTTREMGTEFKKAVTDPTSIATFLSKMSRMDKVKRKEAGAKERAWVIRNYDITKASIEIEKEFASMGFLADDFDFEFKEEPKDANAAISHIDNTVEWLVSLYKNILKSSEGPEGEGVKYWLKELEGRARTREEVEAYFRHVARTDNEKNNPIKFEDLLDTTGKKRMILVQPRSLGDCVIVTALFEDLRKQYPADEWMFYVATEKQFRDVVESSEYVDKWLEYNPQFDNSMMLQGIGDHKGYFEVSLHPYFATQKANAYTQNGYNNTSLDLQG